MNLKYFNEFINESLNNFFKNTNLELLRLKIENWCKKMGIKNYEIIEDKKYGYVINVNGNVYLNNKNLTKIPFKFSVIKGKFDISNNNLESLENCSDECIEFNCSNNIKLKSLIGGPKKVKKYYISNCNLRNLEGAPEECEIFDCSYNFNLKSLMGGPKKVKTYDCSNCDLKSLGGAPEECEYFNCSENSNLKSLEGGPRKTKKYNCKNCALITLDGAPEECEIFNCKYNPGKFTEENVKHYIKNVKQIIV